MAKKEKTALTKGKASFNIIGEAKVNDYTFQLDNTYNSGWTDNQLNLGIDCGEGNVVYAEMSGGYFPDKDNLLYVKGVKEANGKKVDDYENSFTIDFEDRHNETILETIASTSFITIGIEKDSKGKTFYKKFLSAYDAVEYVKKHLEAGMVINVKGNIVYESNGENVYIKKKITSIALSKAEPKDYKASFTQTILLDENSIGKPDKEKRTIPLSVYVVDYVGKPKINGTKVEVKKNFAFPVNMELGISGQPENVAKVLSRFFKAKKNEIIEIVVDGKFVEGAAIVNITTDDIPDDIKELIELGCYTEEEALTRCAVGSTNREKRMIVLKPSIVITGEGDKKTTTVSIDRDKYNPDDIELYSAYYASIAADETVANEIINEESDDDDDDLLKMFADFEEV